MSRFEKMEEYNIHIVLLSVFFSHFLKKQLNLLYDVLKIKSFETDLCNFILKYQEILCNDIRMKYMCIYFIKTMFMHIIYVVTY